MSVTSLVLTISCISICGFAKAIEYDTISKKGVFLSMVKVGCNGKSRKNIIYFGFIPETPKNTFFLQKIVNDSGLCTKKNITNKYGKHLLKIINCDLNYCVPNHISYAVLNFIIDYANNGLDKGSNVVEIDSIIELFPDIAYSHGYYLKVYPAAVFGIALKDNIPKTFLSPKYFFPEANKNGLIELPGVNNIPNYFKPFIPNIGRKKIGILLPLKATFN